MLVDERHAGQFEERKYLEAIAVVVGDPEKLGVGIKGDHRASPGTVTVANCKRLVSREMRHPRGE
jgi:hypothetical protein